jgi:hypothetical protein
MPKTHYGHYTEDFNFSDPLLQKFINQTFIRRGTAIPKRRMETEYSKCIQYIDRKSNYNNKDYIT